MQEDTTVDEVKSRVDIAAVIGRQVDLKKAGRHYKGLCPFHGEKTPSFIVSPELKLFKCFGCGKGGDVFTFQMDMLGMDFRTALEQLAAEVGVTLPKKTRAGGDENKKYYDIYATAVEAYHYVFKTHSTGERAREYMKKRGVSEEMIDRFKVGYAPNQWHFLEKYLIKKGYSLPDMVASGLLVRNDRGQHYDRFRERVLVGVTDKSGRAVGFMGRSLGDGEPKYLNSPDSPIFHKGSNLFGFFEARSAIKAAKGAVLVEGPFDVIVPASAGFKNIVATLGTALTGNHLQLLKQVTNKIILCFDNDAGGLQATIRAITLAQAVDCEVLVLPLPEGMDPDEWVLASPKKFEKAISQASPAFDFLFHLISTKYNPETAQGKKKIKEILLPVVQALSDPVSRKHYQERLSELLGGMDMVNFSPETTPLTWHARQTVVSQKTAHVSLEEYSLSLLFHCPENIFQQTRERFREDLFSDERFQRLFAAYLHFNIDGTTKIEEFSRNLDPDLAELFLNIYLEDVGSIVNDPILFQRELESVLRSMHQSSIKRELRLVATKIKLAEDAQEDKEVANLEKRFQELTKKLI